MNLKIKNSLILAGTLILGIIIGVLISGRVMHSRVENMKSFYTEQGFNRQIMRVIKPTEEQKKQLRPLFREQAKKNHELFTECRNKRSELMKHFKSELEGYLTDEQMQRLEKMEMRMRKNHPGYKKQGHRKMK